jgi:sensor histidine kinase regulating citrate/malate metabolism
MIIIHMENNYDQIIQKDDMYLSMKKGNFHGKNNFHGKGNFHGIGLKRIADIVDEAEGIFQTNADNHVFTIHIMIPQKEDAHEYNDFNS